MLIDLVLDFAKIFNLDEEPLPISSEYFHEITVGGSPVYEPYPILLKYKRRY